MARRIAHKEKVSALGEFGLIDRVRKLVGNPASAICGIGDDAAVLPLDPKKYLLLTADMLTEGVHFTNKTSGEAIGRKAIASSISDIAAMGGLPRYAVVSIGLKPSTSWAKVEAIYRGMRKIAKKFGTGIVGGDTVRHAKLVINVAMIGEVGKKHLVRRNGARPGDQIFVTGGLGRSLAGERHLRFIPRVDQAQYLVSRFKPNAMIDISDGLVADLGHILAQSRTGAVLEEASIPLNKGARLKDALYDGEDFELLFTMAKSKSWRLQNQRKGKFMFHRIGEVTKRRGIQLMTPAGRLKKAVIKGYTHF